MDHDFGFDFDEAVNREGLCKNDIAALRNPPIDGAPKNITDKLLLCFLDACDKNVEEARKVIKIYYDARRNAPEHFTCRDPQNPKIQQCFENQDYFHLPPTPKGYSVIYHRLSNPKASNYVLDEAIKTYFMTIDSCLHTQGPRPGIIFLFDMQNVGLMHLTRVKLGSVKKFFHYLQDALPAKLKAIHVVNAVSFFDKILYLIKPFMKAEIVNLLFLHPTNTNLDKFYEEWIPRSCLPSDFGGDLKSVDELHQEHLLEFERLRPYYLAEENQRDESETALIENTENKMRKLDID